MSNGLATRVRSPCHRARGFASAATARWIRSRPTRISESGRWNALYSPPSDPCIAHGQAHDDADVIEPIT